jgi:glycosyltransferase involved in cell wall biosynthesis
MKRVLAITSGIQQAAARLRIADLIQPLRERGIDLQMTTWGKNPIARARLLRSACEFDAVILQRRLIDFWNARALRRRAKRILFDVDDAIMYHAGPVGLISRIRTGMRFKTTCKILDHVVAGNAYLAERFAERGCETSIQPTVVDPRHYQVKLHRPTDTPRLVWIGSRSTLPYLATIAGGLKLAAERTPGLRLTVIADRTWDNPPLPVDFVLWSEDAEAAALAAADIGIAPTPCDRWTLGKCGFKIIQYMAAGLPVVASPVGANAVIVREGLNGYLPQTDTAWADAINQLAGDVMLRATLGATARRDVWSIYNVERAADHWAMVLGA